MSQDLGRIEPETANQATRRVEGAPSDGASQPRRSTLLFGPPRRTLTRSVATSGDGTGQQAGSFRLDTLLASVPEPERLLRGSKRTEAAAARLDRLIDVHASTAPTGHTNGTGAELAPGNVEDAAEAPHLPTIGSEAHRGVLARNGSETGEAGPAGSAPEATFSGECSEVYTRLKAEFADLFRDVVYTTRTNQQEVTAIVRSLVADVSNLKGDVAQLRAQAPEDGYARALRDLRRDVNGLMEAHARYLGSMHGGEEAEVSVEERFGRVAQRLAALEAQTAAQGQGVVDVDAEAEAPKDARNQVDDNDAKRKKSKRKSRKGAKKSRKDEKARSDKKSKKDSKRKSHKSWKSRRGRKDEPDPSDSSSSSSSDSSSSSSDSSSDSDSDNSSSSSSSDGRSKRSSRRSSRKRSTRSTIRSGLTREKGPRHEDSDFKEIRPSDPLYRKLLSYRYYRLQKTDSSRTGRQTGKTRDHIRRMEITLKDYMFGGDDPIKVLEFLSKYCEEADTLEMTEAQAYVVLPYLLKGSAKEQFNAVKGTLAGDGGVTNWPEAVQYLLRTYATNSAIREAILALRDTKPRDGETETAFDARLNKAFHRCGNVHSREDRIAYFIDGLLPSIKDLVARHREAKPRTNYLEVVTYAKAEGEAYRSRFPARTRVAAADRDRQDRTRKAGPSKRIPAMLVESTVDSREYSAPDIEGVDNIQLLGDELITPESSSLLFNTVVTPDEGYEADSIAYIGNHVPAPRLPYETRSLQGSRPGWRDNRRVSYPSNRGPQRRPLNTANTSMFICYCCYEKGHSVNQCVHPMRDRRTVIANYEALTDAEKENVPKDSYMRAKADLSRSGLQPTMAEPNAVMATEARSAEQYPRVLGNRNDNQGN